jgi:hypothetical protein
VPEAAKFREIEQDGTLRLLVHAGQHRALTSEARIINVQSGTQGGKTCIGPHWLYQEMKEKGPGDYLAVTATFPLLRLKMLPELRAVFEHLYQTFEWKAADKVFESKEKIDGAPAYRILVGSANNAESLESATAKGAWLDEAGQEQFGRDAWDAVIRRLSISRGRVLITTTPYEWGWHYFEVYRKSPEGGGEDLSIETICFDSIANPAFPVEEYEERQRSMPWWKFAMFYRGQYERPAGAVYDTFRPETQVIAPIALGDWPRFTAHDFGASNTAAIWMAQDPKTGWIYIYRDYLRGELSPGQHVDAFKRLSEGEPIRQRVGGSGGKDEDEKRYSYLTAGWPVIAPTRREFEAGLMHAYSFVATNQLFVFSTCEKFINEIMSYSYKLDESYEPKRDEIVNKSAYHLLDCWRYGASIFAPERAAGQRKGPLKPYNDRDRGNQSVLAGLKHG